MGRQHSCVTKQMLHAPHTQDAQNAAEVFQFCAISRLVNWQKCMAQDNSTILRVAGTMFNQCLSAPVDADAEHAVFAGGLGEEGAKQVVVLDYMPAK